MNVVSIKQYTATKTLTLASSMPEIDTSRRSSTRKAARLAVYDATMIIAKPAHTIPRTLALKLRGVPAGVTMNRYIC